MSDYVKPRPLEFQLNPERAPLNTNLNLWGTTSGDWQGETKQFLKSMGIQEAFIYDPKLPEGQSYTAENTKQEIEAFRNGGFHLMQLEDDSAGKISHMESGVLAIRSALGGARGFIKLEPLQSKHSDDPRVIRGRRLVETALREMADIIPQGSLSSVIAQENPVSQANAKARIEEWLREHTSRIGEAKPEEHILGYQVAAVRKTLFNRVFVGGTSTPPEGNNAKSKLLDHLRGAGARFVDAHSSEAFTQERMESEFQSRADSAVVTHIITNESDSLGAISEVFWLALSAALHGQRFGLYMEPSNAELISEDALKLRSSLRMHLEIIQKDFPGLIHIFESPEGLAQWAEGELAKFQEIPD